MCAVCNYSLLPLQPFFLACWRRILLLAYMSGGNWMHTLCADLVHALLSVCQCVGDSNPFLSYSTKQLSRGWYFFNCIFAKSWHVGIIGEVHKLKLEGRFLEAKIGTVENSYIPCTLFLLSPVPLDLMEYVILLGRIFVRAFWKSYNGFMEARACVLPTEHCVLSLSPHPVSPVCFFSVCQMLGTIY